MIELLVIEQRPRARSLAWELSPLGDGLRKARVGGVSCLAYVLFILWRLVVRGLTTPAGHQTPMPAVMMTRLALAQS